MKNPGARARGLIDDVDRVTALEEVIAPAFAAVGRSHEVRPGLPAAVPHHDRIGLRAVLRDLVLHVHLAGHDLAVARLRIPAADEEIALLCEGSGSMPRPGPCGTPMRPFFGLIASPSGVSSKSQ